MVADGDAGADVDADGDADVDGKRAAMRPTRQASWFWRRGWMLPIMFSMKGVQGGADTWRGTQSSRFDADVAGFYGYETDER